MDNNSSPEKLHDKAKSLGKSATTPSFVNPGTPAGPLATESQLVSPTLKEGSKKLNDHLSSK